MKRYCSLLIAILMVFILCACNVKKDEIPLKNEEEIAVDLKQMQQSEIGLSNTFSLTSVEILDRQTDVEADYKVDHVYTTAIFEGNTCTVYKSFVLNYGTYEDTWNLDSIKDYNAGKSECKLKELPAESLIDEYFNEYNTKYEGSSVARFTDWEIINPGDYDLSTTVKCIAKVELEDAIYGAIGSATFKVDIPFKLDAEGDFWYCYSSALPKAEDEEILSVDISPKGNWLAREGNTCTINNLTWDGKSGTLDAHATCDEYEFGDFLISSAYLDDDFFQISGTCTKYWNKGSEEMDDLHWDITIKSTSSCMDICRYSYGLSISYYAPID